MNLKAQILQRTDFGVLVKIRAGKFWLPRAAIRETEKGIFIPKRLARAKGIIK